MLGDLADASTEAVKSVGEYVEHLRETVAPNSKASFRLGQERFEQKLRLDEGINIPAHQLLSIAQRELEATQEEFLRVAATVDSDPMDAWRQVKSRHPSADELVAVVREQVQALHTFLERKPIVTIPENAGLRIAPTPDFYRWTFASLWTPGPFETASIPAYYYITNVDPTWTIERQ